MLPLEPPLHALISRVARYPRRVLLGVAFLTLVFALGLTRLQVATDLLDWLPAQDPDVRAFARVVREMQSLTNQELVWLELDPTRAAALGVTRISDEDAVRAQAELVDFVRARVPEVVGVFGLPQFVALARGESGLPASSAEFRVIVGALEATQGELLAATLSADRERALLGFILPGDPLAPESHALAGRLREALAAYGDAPKTFDLFADQTLVPIGLASGLFEVDARLERQGLPLALGAALVVALLLAVALRHAGATLVALASLAVALLWTLGAMGVVGVRLNIINAAVVPLIIGSGIDYAIHALYALQRGAATRTVTALGVTSAVTVLGLASLTLSGVPGLVDLGLAAAFAMTTLYALSLTLFPAAAALGWVGVRRHVPAPAPRLRLPRWLALPVVALLCGAALWGQTRTVYQLDVIQGNFPADDPVTRALGRLEAGVGGAFPEFVILEGPFDAARLAQTRDLAADLRSEGVVIDPAQVVGGFEALRGGPLAAAGRLLLAGGDTARLAPTRDAALGETLAAMRETAVWRPILELVLSPADDLAVVLVIPRSPVETLEVARDLYGRLRQGAADLGGRVLGYRTLGYRFIETSLTGLRRLFAVSLISAALLVGVLTRRWQSTLYVVLVMALSSLWWFGALPAAGIYISVFLIFPLVFSVAVGSDFAVHLALSGRAALRPVLFSALTTAATFALFTGVAVVSVQQVMLAVVLAVAASLLAALLLSSWGVER